MTGLLEPHAIGAPLERLDGRAKVTGTARYAVEHLLDDPVYLHPVQSTIARGRIAAVDPRAAEALDGVVAVITPANVPRLSPGDDRELTVLQSEEISYRGQFVAAVVAETSEIARQAADLVEVAYHEQPHDARFSADRDDLYAPGVVNPDYPTDTLDGDPDAALAAAAVRLDATYTTPMEHNNPMEPHATVALWADDTFTLYDSTQGPNRVRDSIAGLFGLPSDRVRVIAPYVGGGFGSKTVHPNVVLAALAARTVAGRPVTFALTRQQMFSLVGYRTPTIQRIRLGADADGRLTAITHDVAEQTSRIKEFAEQTAVPSRGMYAAPNRRTTHRLAALDVPIPTWMRAPGECPGMFALESAMDEMALACGLDPIEFRIRNEPGVDPETGLPFSSRGLVGCLREGARRFDWQRRDPTPAARREDGWLVGTGVAASTFPAIRIPGSAATVRRVRDGRYRVEIAAVDIGTGAWTALTQIAADALDVPVEAVDLEIGDTALPPGSVAGGSSGTASWGWAVVDAAREFREKYGPDPEEGDEAGGVMPDNPDAERFAMHAYGAQFAEVRVHADTGEIRVPRLLGVFAVGRIINPRTARSQLIGGMTMGVSMALHEHSVLDPRFGQVANHDFAAYHIAANADIGLIDATWIEEDDPYVNPMGAKGIGEIGIVGTAAAIANAAYHATGIRVRDLPLTADRFLH
ncbi:xanthine dehydrogenase family protein molybdopterin-binding subunit [Pseudonocardia acidicola]|uniref:Xanthine dehydrogenase family protein molybdopterin-binding subunit n=1 Tax=Pseudonocardia acidicola TaxID=2724939 RepID=A0ABX1SN45_9PSEU|nr:xanthine dehydrogenase family protein molybdopterin-binding subunit [Pseudonocardia acidicola]NMI01564.1 xanthine dehydrogenase family protein molybdopterin-binding subunit [Pseudonocardia acidicola]